MSSVKGSNFIATPHEHIFPPGNKKKIKTIIFKMKWKIESQLPVEALEEKMGFSGCILGSIFPQYVTFSAAMEHQKALLWCLPSVSSASPATSTPLALKGEDIPTTRSRPWPKTVGAKGSGFPSLHLDASGPRVTVGTPPAAEEILAPSSAFQTSPGELCTEDQNLLYPISSGV